MRRAGTVAVLVLALAGCTPQPAPSAARSEVPVESSEPRADEPDASQIVGGYGELHVAPDGAMLFCASDDDPGFTGSWRDCADGIRTAGVDTAAIDASLGSAPADPGGHRWSGAAAGRRSLEDGTLVYSVFLAGTRTDDSFTVSSVGTAEYRIPSEYQELRPGVPGGFLVRLVPED